MATSIISRRQGLDSNTSDSSQLLQAGLTQKAFHRLVQQYPHDPSTAEIRAYITESVNAIVPTLNNASKDTSYPLDRLSNGNNLINLYQQNNNASYLETITALKRSIDLQRRNGAGGLWYYVYPKWSYLDGMYSFTPFYTLYTNTFSKGGTATAAFNDILLQLGLLYQHCYNNATGLLVHGYDYSKTAVWANPVTGGSPHVWGRSLGWYMMALVDTIELSPHLDELRQKFKTLSEGVVKAVDPASGAWWQILDEPGKEGNYIESSGSAMFVYALFKGSRVGYLPHYEKTAARAYEYIVKNFVVDSGNGTLGYNRTVAVCSLNSTASYEVSGPPSIPVPNRILMESLQYYVSQPILYNSVLGSGSFVLASLEYELYTAKYEQKHGKD